MHALRSVWLELSRSRLEPWRERELEHPSFVLPLERSRERKPGNGKPTDVGSQCQARRGGHRAIAAEDRRSFAAIPSGAAIREDRDFNRNRAIHSSAQSE